MKKAALVIVCLSVVQLATAQGIPDWFIEEINQQEGVWVAENDQYKSESEPIDQYAIEWTLSPVKTSVFGRLYGIQNGKELGSFWSFHKYWDPATKQVMLTQVGSDGSVGKGSVRYISRTKMELTQVFTSPQGVSRKEGHRTEYTSDSTEVGSSFSISEDGEWTIRRTYTWKKVS